MTDSTTTFSTGTLQAWMRLPRSIRLVSAIVAAIAISWAAVAVINAPTAVSAIAPAAAGAAPLRDPSVPDAGQALSVEERPQEVSTPTF